MRAMPIHLRMDCASLLFDPFALGVSAVGDAFLDLFRFY